MQREFPKPESSRRHSPCPLTWFGSFAGLVLIMGSALPLCGQDLVNPRRITSGPKGQLIVVDRMLDYVAGVDQESLEVVWRVQLPGQPYGIAYHKKRLFIGDTATHNVGVYEIVKVKDPALSKEAKGLEFRFNLGHTVEGQPGYLERPVDIAIHTRSNRVYVLDAADKKVKVYDTGGDFLFEFAPVAADGKLFIPVALTVDDIRQELLVSDYGNPEGFFGISAPARIHIYDLDGIFQAQIMGNGTTALTTKFLRPQGLVSDGLGRIFVTAALQGKVLVLDRATGALLATLGEAGSEPGQLQLPVDLFLDGKTGDLFVVNNMGARRLEVFRGVGR